MIKRNFLETFGWVIFVLGFVIIFFNAFVYLFNVWFSWAWLSLIGLVLVIVGMKIIRISKERKIKNNLRKKK